MTKKKMVLSLVLLTMIAAPLCPLWGADITGNELALIYMEAKTDYARKMIVEEYIGRPFYFRYLSIEKMKEGKKNGYPYVYILAREPSSYMMIEITVTKKFSLQRLWEEPGTKPGDGIAIQGRVESMNHDYNLMVVRPVIMKHKDRLEPKVGKEMLYHINKAARFYSYTGGDKAVSIGYQDRDLLQHKNTYLGQGKQAWTDFLTKEIAERKAAREKLKITTIRSKLDSLKEDEK